MTIGHGAIAVAFDMDGLMFETESVYWKSAEILLGRRGHEYTQEICDAVMGRTPEFAFRYFIQTFSLSEDWRSLQRESEDIFVELLKDGYETQPGFSELLDLLEERNIPRCVCTSSARRVVTEVLKKDGIGERFDFVLTSDDITRGKPDPEVYQLAARRFGVEAGAMLVLEDSSAGAASARSAGAPCCMLRAEHNFNADFSNAVAVVERLDAPELVALLAPCGKDA
ncbi:MAG: HAD-IA family hydrolase [Thermoguttaceae bacterium]|nr:HAD-IA family hydrolase [Thermoguttaceae bacterium]